MAAKPRLPEAPVEANVEAEVAAAAAALDARFGHLTPIEVVERAALHDFAGGIVAVSSFGADSAVLLHMIAEVDRGLPVIFLDTGKHFGETLEYRDALIADLGLTDIRVVTPDEAALDRDDPDGTLHGRDTEACCAIRKVEPMARGVEPFRAWFTGRKRFQAATRAALPVFESVGIRTRINPLARWTTADLADYMRRHALRENPLVAYGYLSIGCFPCTQPVKPGEDARSGRWAGQAKTECGIHLGGLDRSLAGPSI
ncbi:phosphoadenosine phosphosulfate reductase [Mesorhizobium sp. L-8-10]|uniref:phosphoadenylyl-sulfate reductase n=1 Tax=Mesorhizobium sp. L-8-10 TaxID=2744523 RepID=UPI0019274097|nr:phosphoadenylyl-sulfate reductase [Mesorhizobium sp. L-8-10]BCH28642.1 phosphoadenosine phosphosulfate reductase [Mesorhizobium sp. L-8-10]